MSLRPGTTLGDYELKSLIGVGSMGEVYRARDRVLKREVAVKVLPEAFAKEEERLSRFEREARLLASLNHANIAVLHGVGRVDETRFLVLELVDGETLAEIFRRGPLPLNRALPMFVQLAGALEAAHEKGIVHRDLKPANIKITTDGRVKVLDFGVAKCLSPELILDTGSTTGTDDSSDTGMVVGSAGYMSPEQARGLSIDERADIWAFGCVLFEALTGTRAFRGRTVAETLAIVLEHEPKWHLIPANTPARLKELVKRCLRKDPRHRLHDIADVRIELEELPSSEAEQVEPASPAARHPWRAGALALGALLLGLLGGTAWQRLSSDSAKHARRDGVARFEIELPPGRFVPYGKTSSLAIAPDGSRLLLSMAEEDGVTRLHERKLDELVFTPLRGTERSYDPFFSPAGGWFGYFTAESGKFLLKRLAFEGGTAVAFHEEASRPEGGAAWGEDGDVVFAASDALYHISANGGVRSRLIPAPTGGGEVQRWPEILPGGNGVLYTEWTAASDTQGPRVIAQSLHSGERHVLVEKGTFARYSPAGQVIFAWDGAIYAAPLDLDELRLKSPPVRIVDGVRMDPESGVAQFAVSRNGILAYVPGRPGDRLRRLVKVDSAGAGFWESGQGMEMSGTFRLSPDGSAAAFAQVRVDGVDVWVHELETGATLQLTDGGSNHAPVWSPDGKAIIYRSEGSGPAALYRKEVAGAEPPRRLTDREDDPTPSSWVGTSLAFTARNEATGLGIWKLDLETGESELLQDTDANESDAAFSPSGKWVAFSSDATGRQEIYLTSSAPPWSPSRVSEGGGDTPRWAPDGGKLYYRRGGDLLAVEIGGDATPQAGPSAVVWSLDYDAPFEVLSGGGFLVAERSEPSNRIIVLLNFEGMIR